MRVLITGVCFLSDLPSLQYWLFRKGTNLNRELMKVGGGVFREEVIGSECLSCPMSAAITLLFFPTSIHLV